MVKKNVSEVARDEANAQFRAEQSLEQLKIYIDVFHSILYDYMNVLDSSSEGPNGLDRKGIALSQILPFIEMGINEKSVQGLDPITLDSFFLTLVDLIAQGKAYNEKEAFSVMNKLLECGISQNSVTKALEKLITGEGLATQTAVMALQALHAKRQAATNDFLGTNSTSHDR